MDLLAGYGSEGDSDGDGVPAPVAAAPPRAAAARPAPAPVSGLSRLPAPKVARGGGGASLFSSLPAPRADVRGASAPSPSGTTGKTVQWRPPISAAALSAANDEEERPRKVSKSTKGSSLMSMLPKPKNVLGVGTGGGTEALLGGGSSGPRSLGGGGSSQSHHQSPASRPAAAAAAAEPSTGYGGNNIYRVDASGAYGAQAYAAAPPTAAPAATHHYSSAPAATRHSRGAPPAGPSRHYDYNPQEHVVATAYEGTLETLQESTAPVKQAMPSSSEAGNGLSLLQAELERERDRQVKLGRKPGKVPKIVNINQEKLKYVAPTVNAAQTAAETAFGPQYKAQLRKEAGDKGSKTARKKHQIGTLYHEMKLAELDMLENRSGGQKSKAETAAKYGW